MPQVLEVGAGTFVIVEDGLWWPGRYDSPGAARRAAALCEEVLSRLQRRKNDEARGAPAVITVADLDALA